MLTRREDYPESEMITALHNAVSLTLDFTDEELKALAAISHAEEYEEGDYLMTEDEQANDLYIIAQGTVGIELRLAPDSHSSAQIHKAREGSVLGEFAFIDGARRSASVKMLEKSLVVRFPSADLYALCDNNFSIGYKIMRNLAILLAQRMRNITFELRSHLYM